MVPKYPTFFIFFEPSSYFCCIFLETPTLLFFPTSSSFFTENHDNWNQKHIAKVSRVMMLLTLLSINECSGSKCFFWSKKSCLSHVLLRLLILSFHLGPLESLYCSLVIIQGTTVSAGCKCRKFFSLLWPWKSLGICLRCFYKCRKQSHCS